MNDEVLPNHIAILPNGNRTWARQRGLHPSEGHKKGAEVLREITRHMRNRGIHTATVWGASTENFKTRSKEEMKNLVKLLDFVMENWAYEADEDEARIVHIGRKDVLPKAVVKNLQYWENKTRHHTRHVLNIAFGYGGHDEIIRGFKKAYKDIQEGKITIDDLAKTNGFYNGKYPYMKFKDYLDTGDQPYPFPDLIIRSANENRLSGFMPWQSVYAEIISVKKLNPEFTPETIEECIKIFQTRNRKFGGDDENNQ